MENIVSNISTLRDVSIAALFVLLFMMWWTERKDQQKRERADRDMFSSQLKEIIRDEIESRSSSAEAMAKLAESINNFQKNCIAIQEQLQAEVDRMRRL